MQTQDRTIRHHSKPSEIRLSQRLSVPDFPLAVVFSHELVTQESWRYFEPHHHDCCELIVILDGAGIQRIDSEEYFVNGGDVYLIKPHIPHYFKDCELDSISFCSIFFDDDQLNLPQNYLSRMPGYNMIFNYEPQTRSKTGFSEHLRLSPDNLKTLHLQLSKLANCLAWHQTGVEARSFSLLIRIFINLASWYDSMLPERYEDNMLTKINGLVTYIKENYNRKFTLADLAARICCSERTLTRAFRTFMGCSPIEYILKIRLSSAAELLASTSMPVTSIAFKCGFADANYFSRRFAAQYGMSARRYREKHAASTHTNIIC